MNIFVLSCLYVFLSNWFEADSSLNEARYKRSSSRTGVWTRFNNSSFWSILGRIVLSSFLKFLLKMNPIRSWVCWGLKCERKEMVGWCLGWDTYLLGCLSCWSGAVRSSNELKAASNAALSIRFDWQKFSKFLKHCSKFVLHSCAWKRFEFFELYSIRF